jgi:hypothetical protein
MPAITPPPQVTAVAEATVRIIAPNGTETPTQLAARKTAERAQITLPPVFLPADRVFSLEVSRIREKSTGRAYPLVVVNFD